MGDSVLRRGVLTECSVYETLPTMAREDGRHWGNVIGGVSGPRSAGGEARAIIDPARR